MFYFSIFLVCFSVYLVSLHLSTALPSRMERLQTMIRLWWAFAGSIVQFLIHFIWQDYSANLNRMMGFTPTGKPGATVSQYYEMNKWVTAACALICPCVLIKSWPKVEMALTSLCGFLILYLQKQLFFILMSKPHILDKGMFIFISSPM